MSYFKIREYCPLCKSQQLRQHFKVSYHEKALGSFIERSYHHRGGIPSYYLQGGYYDLNSCKRCGLVFQSCIPQGKLLDCIYNPIFSDDLKLRKSKTKNLKSMKFVESDARQVIKITKSRQSARVLDYGVGYGTFARFLLEKGIEVHGTELNEEASSFAKNKGVKILTDTELLSYKYDFINTDQVLEHVVYPDTVISLLATLLTDFGILKISVPNAKNIVLDIDQMDFDNAKKFNAATPLQHINVFSDAVFEYIASNWNLHFTRPIQFDIRFPLYTFSRTLKRRFTPNNGAAWFENVK